MTLRYQLSNGLTVVFEEQHASKVAAFQVWVQAGSADERLDQAGLAHLHEHMLFKGTSKRGPGEIAHDIEAHGGEINAWTSFDQTVYHVVIASQFARHGLEILADAIRHSAFDPTELSREIEVVVEEIKRSADTPGRRASKELFAAAYSVHPYQRPVIGWEESVRSFSREKVLEFYHRFYTPKNLVLSVAGDLREEELRAWVDECFGGDFGIPFSGAVTRPVEPPLSNRRVKLAAAPIKEAYWNLAFPIPSVLHEDTPALDVLGMLAGHGESSRLSLNVKRPKSLVNDIHAYAYTPKDAGLWVASMTLPAEKWKQALHETLRVLKHLKTEAVSDNELAVMKSLVESEAIYQRETVQGLSRKLGYFESGGGGIEQEARYFEQVSRLSPTDILQVAKKYLNFERMVVSALLPENVTLAESEVHAVFEEVASEKAPVSVVRKTKDTVSGTLKLKSSRASGTSPKQVVEKLPNGAQLIIRPETAVPLFAMRAVFKGGLRYETQANNGLTTLLSRLWTRGTPSHDAEEISHLSDDMSGALAGMGGRNSMSLRGEFLSKHFDQAFDLFADCLCHPTFPEAEFVREQDLLLQDIHNQEDRPSSMAFDLFAHTLFQQHPYRFSTLGEIASVKALTPSLLQQYHQGYLDPSQLTFCVVGDVKVDEVLKKAQNAFGKVSGKALPAPTVPWEEKPAAPREARKLLDKAQAHLVFGFQGLRINEPQRRDLEVLSTILSGQGGRLFVELRDKRSMAYSVSSFSVEGLDPGYFAVYMGTSPEKVPAALEGIRAELQRLLTEPIEAAELERAKQHLIGTHEIGLQRNGARAGLMALDQCYGLGAEDFLHYAEAIEKVTPKSVQAVAQRILQFQHSVLAYVGP